jgi:hypothetical protein
LQTVPILELDQRTQTFPWNVDLLDRAQRGTDYFFSSERAEIRILGKALSESFKKSLIVLCSVESFSAKKLQILVFPRSFQIVNPEQFLEFGWNVFQKGENSLWWVFVSENIENEAFRCYEGIAI